jgi:hypothetical protein
MSQYQFIKGTKQMERELRNLWNNYPLYKFIHGAQYVRKREIEICECIPNHKNKRDLFIELVRFDWLIEQPIETKKKKKPR